jgi:hypothetical protein
LILAGGDFSPGFRPIRKIPLAQRFAAWHVNISKAAVL